MADQADHQIQIIRDAETFDRCASMMFIQDPWKRIGFSLEDCRSAFDGDWREVYGLFFGKDIRGFAIIQVKGTFRGYIQTLCVDPGFHRHGIGSILLKHCESVIHGWSPNVFICVSDFNTMAKQLYQSHGYAEIGILRDFLKPGFHELLLRKSAGPIIGYSAKPS